LKNVITRKLLHMPTTRLTPFISAAFLIASLASLRAADVVDLRCEYLTDPLGIDVVAPRFSWKQADPDHVRRQKQTAYQVMVAASSEHLAQDKADLWDSGKVSSPQSVLVPYIQRGETRLQSGLLLEGAA
jgi:alpha-L-rhamnosidase